MPQFWQRFLSIKNQHRVLAFLLQALLALQSECPEGYFKAPLLTKTAANGNKTLCNSGILAAPQIAAYHLYM